jgi:DNA processing protein
MADNNIREIAFLAALNDIQSLKRLEFAQYFHDKEFLHDLYNNIFENDHNRIDNLPTTLKPLIEKSENIRDRKLIDFYIDVIRDYQRKDVHILPYFDSAFPEKLNKIADPPLILYLKGTPACISKPTVAVVGTRKISPRGIECARDIVKTCVQQGFVIVSGLALGTDTIAHKTAIESGGDTVAVLPSDLDHIVPTENKELSDQIIKSGVLVSEISHLVKMHKGRYIERNRITSALSDSVIVIETGESGGSIRQAETALKHGKPVYSLRTDQSNIKSSGGHKKLVSMGAIAIEYPDNFSSFISKLQSPKFGIRTLSDFSYTQVIL